MEIQRKPPRDRGSMKKGDCDTMKKFLALILTLAMALSVTACGGSDDTADDTADGEGAGTEETVDYSAMSELMWAGSLSHNGLTGLGAPKDFAVHQLGHELSARFDLAHGASLAAVWGSWAEYVMPARPERFARYARQV